MEDRPPALASSGKDILVAPPYTKVKSLRFPTVSLETWLETVAEKPYVESPLEMSVRRGHKSASPANVCEKCGRKSSKIAPCCKPGRPVKFCSTVTGIFATHTVDNTPYEPVKLATSPD